MGIGIYKKGRRKRPAAFANVHGLDDIVSVSIIERDHPYAAFTEICEGQILVKIRNLQAYAPVIDARVASAVTNKKVFKVTQPELLKAGLIVQLGDQYRVITSVNLKTGDITIQGDGVTLKEGQKVIVNQTYGSALVVDDVNSGTDVMLSSVETFSVGDEVTIKGTKYTISSVDGVKKKVTLDKAATLKAGDIAIGGPSNDYKIAVETKEIAPDERNVLIATRDHGRVWKQNLIGFDDEMKKYFPLIIFDESRR